MLRHAAAHADAMPRMPFDAAADARFAVRR